MEGSVDQEDRGRALRGIFKNSRAARDRLCPCPSMFHVSG